jgi:hypothetical protein
MDFPELDPMTSLLALCLCVLNPPDPDRTSVLIVVGAPGSPEYSSQFREWAGRWKFAAERAGAETTVIGEADEAGIRDLDRLRDSLAARAVDGTGPLWIVLIGHGTYDGREAKFNLRGPDVTDLQLSGWLEKAKRPIAMLDCTSASAPFLNRLSAPGRVIVTATRSGGELNFARLGQYLSETNTDPKADLDKDGQVSLLEAFLTASKRVNEYYKTHAQLATEHALIDDNGDRLGTPADWFRGVRATRRAKDGAPLDGLRAHQLHLIRSEREQALPEVDRRRRDELELSLATLRDQKARLGDEEYYRQLEPLMVELAQIYRKAEAPHPGAGSRGN